MTDQKHLGDDLLDFILEDPTKERVQESMRRFSRRDMKAALGGLLVGAGSVALAARKHLKKERARRELARMSSRPGHHGHAFVFPKTATHKARLSYHIETHPNSHEARPLAQRHVRDFHSAVPYMAGTRRITPRPSVGPNYHAPSVRHMLGRQATERLHYGQ